MKRINYKLFTICLCFLVLGLASKAQPLENNEGIKNYNEEFVKELKKPWEEINLQKTGEVSDELENIIEEKMLQGILPKNKEMMDYDLQFAEELRSGEWREVQFSKTDSFDMEKPAEPDLIFDTPILSENLIPKPSTPKPKTEKLKIPTNYYEKYKQCVGEVAFTDNIKFYGYEFPIYYDHKVKNYPLESPIDIGNFWEALARSEWEVFLKQIEEYADAIHVKYDDWAYALLINKIGKNIYLHNRNASTLFTCFMLNHSGLYAKMTYDNNLNLNLLLVTKDKILNTLYEYDTFDYYYYNFRPPTTKGIGRTTTPSIRFNPPNVFMKPIASFVRKMPKLLDKLGFYNTIEFTFYTSSGKEKVEGNVNYNRLEYYKDIPPTSLEVYFEAGCFIRHNDKLVHDLGVLLAERKTYEQKINLLLDFTSANDVLGYEPDTQTLFPEETLSKDKSDCEDRAVLFAALANRLLDIKVLGIKYKNPSDHVIVAVPHKSDIPLNALEHTIHNKEFYILCDPTAYGASYGKVAPKREIQDYDKFDFPTRCVD